MMKILVCNDDGISSPGLTSLAEVAAQFGRVIIFAPEVEQSAVGHAITIKRPLEFSPAKLAGFEAFSVKGTPADCVALGLYYMGNADLVLSGINLGVNLGRDLWHSGTVAVAKQAEFSGIQAIAFSKIPTKEKSNYEIQKPFVEEIIKLLTRGDHPRLVNVNLPENPVGMKWTHQTLRYYNHKIIKSDAPNELGKYRFIENPATTSDEGSDRWAIDNNLVSLTPLRESLTDEDWLKRLTAEVANTDGSN